MGVGLRASAKVTGAPTEPYSGDAGAISVGYAAVGTTWVASKPGGLNISE